VEFILFALKKCVFNKEIKTNNATGHLETADLGMEFRTIYGDEI
jgi:hypothetical protein